MTSQELQSLEIALKELVERKEEIRRLAKAADVIADRIKTALEDSGLTELIGDGVRGLLYDTTATRSDTETARKLLTQEEFDSIFTTKATRAFKASRI